MGIGINPPIYKLDIAAGTGSHFIRLKTTTDNQTGIILGTSTYNWSFGVHGGGSGTLKLSTTAGDVTAATTAGFTTTAGSSELYLVEVKSADLPDGKNWVHLKAVEVANDPVLGGILVILGDAKYGGNSLPSAI